MSLTIATNVSALSARRHAYSSESGLNRAIQRSSRSRIRDADYAAETAELTKTMILQQSATSIIAQANATPQLTLALLR